MSCWFDQSLCLRVCVWYRCGPKFDLHTFMVTYSNLNVIDKILVVKMVRAYKHRRDSYILRSSSYSVSPAFGNLLIFGKLEESKKFPTLHFTLRFTLFILAPLNCTVHHDIGFCLVCNDKVNR